MSRSWILVVIASSMTAACMSTEGFADGTSESPTDPRAGAEADAGEEGGARDASSADGARADASHADASASCGAVDVACAAASPCCEGLFCDPGPKRCRACQDEGKSCGSDDACCSKRCVSGVCE